MTEGGAGIDGAAWQKATEKLHSGIERWRDRLRRCAGGTCDKYTSGTCGPSCRDAALLAEAAEADCGSLLDQRRAVWGRRSQAQRPDTEAEKHLKEAGEVVGNMVHTVRAAARAAQRARNAEHSAATAAK